MKRAIVGVSIICLTFLINSCDTNEPPPPPDGEKPTLELKLEDVSCIEAWITLTTTNLQLPAIITLKQFNPTGDTISQILSLNTKDSLLYIDSLLPNKTYTFLASHSGLSGISSNELSVTTMDTTSHDFTFHTWTFGTNGSLGLYDVAIINENDIWSVGEINIADTSINGYSTYNTVHWNGINWTLLQTMFYTICGQQHRTPYPASSVFVFSENDIWVAMGGDQVARWDGTTQIATTCLLVSFSITRLWGEDSNSMYAVGDLGKILHYQNGFGWQAIQSGTSTIITDAWGIITNNNETVLYCPVSSFFVPGDKKILKITNNIVDSVYWNKDVRLYSAWAVNENILYVCGEGVYVNKFGKWDQIDLYPVGTNSVRGNNLNDIFVVGDYGSIFHFNGISWKMLSTPNNKGYSKVAVKGNMVVICGNYNGQGLIEIGVRN